MHEWPILERLSVIRAMCLAPPRPSFAAEGEIDPGGNDGGGAGAIPIQVIAVFPDPGDEIARVSE